MTDGWAEENELDRLAQWEARITGDPLAFDAAQYIHDPVVVADPDDDYPPRSGNTMLTAATETCARCGGTGQVDALPYTRAPGTGPQTDCPNCTHKETSP